MQRKQTISPIEALGDDDTPGKATKEAFNVTMHTMCSVFSVVNLLTVRLTIRGGVQCNKQQMI